MTASSRDSRTCFVIAPIGEDGSDTRSRSDEVFVDIIEPAASACGYDAVRGDRLSEPGLITEQVMREIIEAPLVVADLSEHNPNVFYELAIRHAVNKPVVQMIRQGDRIPFNVSGMRIVLYNLGDPGSVEVARAEVVRQIRATEKTPSGSHTPLERLLAGALAAKAHVRRLSGVTEVYDYLATNLDGPARTIDDITWGLRRNWGSPDEANAYDRYARSMHRACSRPGVKYREISTLSSPEYFQRALSLGLSYGYHLAWYDTAQCRLPLMSFMLIDRREVVFAFYRFESSMNADEIYAVVTEPLLVELFRDYFETLWDGGAKLKLGADVVFDELAGIASRLGLDPDDALRDLRTKWRS